MNKLPSPEQQPRTARKVVAGLAVASLLLGMHFTKDDVPAARQRVTLQGVLEVPPLPIVLERVTPKPTPHKHTPKAITSHHRPTNINQRFVAKYFAAATEVYERYHVPIDLSLAQASHESNYGESELAKAGHNLFGIKASPIGFANWHGPIYRIPTGEVLTTKQLPMGNVLKQTLRPDGRYNVVVNANFRRYSTDSESFLDYGYYLNNRGFVAPGDCYADAQGLTDPVAYLRAIETDGDGPAGPEKVYASDPNYIQKVSERIAQMHTARVALGLVAPPA